MTARRLILCTAVMLASGAMVPAVRVFPAVAEENRLLPFWGQPFPAGFVRTEPPCPVVRRAPTRREMRDERLDPCPAVLHAKD